EVLQGDRGALDVPARTTGTVRRGPRRLTRTLRAPQQRVERVLLAGALGVSPTLTEQLEHLLAAQPRLGTELVVDGDRGVQVIVDLVDRARLLELADQRDHQRDRLDGA